MLWKYQIILSVPMVQWQLEWRYSFLCCSPHVLCLFSIYLLLLIFFWWPFLPSAHSYLCEGSLYHLIAAVIQHIRPLFLTLPYTKELTLIHLFQLDNAFHKISPIPPPTHTNHVIKTNQDIGTFIAFISVKIIQQPDQLQKHLDF